ncbi:vasopressin/oxytocin-related peptide receptor [Ciona intestinalis]
MTSLPNLALLNEETTANYDVLMTSSIPLLAVHRVRNGTALQRQIRITELYLIATVFILGLIGNSCVLVALWQRYSKHTRMHILIFHLAVADLIVVLFEMLPEWIIRFGFGFFASDAMCKFVKYMQILGMYGSTYVLLCAAFDRYRAIRYPMQSFQLTAKRVHTSVLIAWGVSAVLSTPQLFLFEKPETRNMCRMKRFPSAAFDQAYTTWYFFVIMFIPTCFLIYLYGMIAVLIMRNLKQKNKAGSSTSPVRHGGNFAPRASSTAGISRAKIKTVQMTLVIVITYVLLWTPFFTVQMLAAWGAINEDHIAASCIKLLASLNSCTNPWIYMAFSGNLFGDIKRFILCQKKKKSSFINKSRQGDTSKKTRNYSAFDPTTKETDMTATTNMELSVVKPKARNDKKKYRSSELSDIASSGLMENESEN